MMDYRHLDEHGVDQWVKALLALKGGDLQHAFLSHVTIDDPADFVEYVENCIAGAQPTAYKNEEGKVPTLLNQSGQPVISMTIGHMYLMPARDILRLYDHWEEIPYEEAACPTLWGSITLAEIKAGRIQPIWLAADRQGKEDSARKEIEKATRNQDRAKIDRLVRRCLRWMMAPGHMRGAPELYGNCSLAKAWWCGYFSHECSRVVNADVNSISEALKEIWLGLADYLAGKLTVIGEPNVVAGISLWAQNRIREESRLKRSHVEQTCRTLGEISSWCVLGIKDAPKIEKAILEFKPIHDIQEHKS